MRLSDLLDFPFSLVALSESSADPAFDVTATRLHSDGEPCNCPCECREYCDELLLEYQIPHGTI